MHTPDFISASALAVMAGGRGGGNPFRAVKAFGTHRACEGPEQRFPPAGLAAGVNGVKQRRNFSETHFPKLAALADSVRMGRAEAQRGMAVPVYVTRLGARKRDDSVILYRMKEAVRRDAAVSSSDTGRPFIVNFHHAAILTDSGRMAIHTVKVEEFHSKSLQGFPV